LAEAPSYGRTIFEYEPKCHGAADYQTVAEYIHSQTGTESKKGPEPVVVGEDKGVGEAVEKG
jgi:nitrogenase subunit NifH